MTQDGIKALPEADREKFFRAIMAVVDAGYKANVPPQDLGKMYAETYNQTSEMLKEGEA